MFQGKQQIAARTGIDKRGAATVPWAGSRQTIVAKAFSRGFMEVVRQWRTAFLTNGFSDEMGIPPAFRAKCRAWPKNRTVTQVVFDGSATARALRWI